MASYFQYYAIGMGTGAGANRTVWVEPYEFAASSDIGTTCSTPVYDDNGALIGVVGIDFTLDTFTKYGSSQQVLDRLIDRSRFCPKFTLSECDRQAFRGAISPESVCPTQCDAEQNSLAPQACMADDQYPTVQQLWRNTAQSAWKYQERAC
eukprot:11818-Heterococcus_DN1.PRE.1